MKSKAIYLEFIRAAYGYKAHLQAPIGPRGGRKTWCGRYLKSMEEGSNTVRPLPPVSFDRVQRALINKESSPLCSKCIRACFKNITEKKD